MIYALDAGHTSVRLAEHLAWDALNVLRELTVLRELAVVREECAGGDGAVATTFVAPATPAHYAVRIDWPGTAGRAGGQAGTDSRAGQQGDLGAQVADRLARRWPGVRLVDPPASGSGRQERAVAFPGMADLHGVLTVGEITAACLIEEVVAVGLGRPAHPGETVDTLDFVRPTPVDGRWVWLVRPATRTDFVPFELPDPTPCCAAHAGS